MEPCYSHWSFLILSLSCVLLWYVALNRLRGSEHPRIFYGVVYELKRGHVNPQLLFKLKKDHWSSRNIHIHGESLAKQGTFLRLKIYRHYSCWYYGTAVVVCTCFLCAKSRKRDLKQWLTATLDCAVMYRLHIIHLRGCQSVRL